MTVELEKRGEWWYARIRKPRGQGRAFFQSLGTKNEEEARKKGADANLAQIQLAAQADALTRDVWTRLIAGRKVSVTASVAAFREHREVTGHPTASIAYEQRCLDQFLRFSGGEQFAKLQIAFVEAKHVSEFINRPGDAKLATRTRQLTWLNGWLNYCVAQRWLVVSPALEVRVRIDGLSQQQLVSVPHAPFTEEEIKKLLAAIPRSDFWHGAVLLAYHFGLRLGAIATLEEGNVVANRLRVFTKKGGKIVDEPLPEEIVAWLDEWKKVRPSSDLTFIFPVEATIYFNDASKLSERFRQIAEKAGIMGKTFHGIRKTATKRVWDNALSDLGDRHAQMLAKMVAENGYRKVQAMLAHAPGSDITDRHYLPKNG